MSDTLINNDPSEPRKPLTFPRASRLSGLGTFKRILDENLRGWQGPIGMALRPNDVGRPRLGISIGRSVGNAARRNRIKRLLREAFRHTQHDWPAAYDVVILVKKHEPLALADYQRMLIELRKRLHQKARARGDES